MPRSMTWWRMTVEGSEPRAEGHRGEDRGAGGVGRRHKVNKVATHFRIPRRKSLLSLLRFLDTVGTLTPLC